MKVSMYESFFFNLAVGAFTFIVYILLLISCIKTLKDWDVGYGVKRKASVVSCSPVTFYI